jgi:hypothetical protein
MTAAGDVGTVYRTEDIAPPHVFVSSTLDAGLGELRSALRDNLLQLRYIPVMSEGDAFSYQHGRNAVYDDTIQAVGRSQLYVLIIGRRYGSIHPDFGRSITELEYDAARKQDLPILVFVQDAVKNGWDAWNRDAVAKHGIGHWVDDARVWQFMSRIMLTDACPVFTVSDAHSLVQQFNAQVANLFGAYLRFDHGARHWLWTVQRTGQVELGSKALWILSPNLYWDYQDKEYRDLVFENLTSRRCRYRYLYRATSEMEDQVVELKAEYRRALGDAAADLVRFAPIPDDDFFWCTEQVIFDPRAPSEKAIVVDICEDRDHSRKYDIEMGRFKRLFFRKQFEALWAKYSDETLD